MLNLKTIDGGWSLFLDRDGVINVEKPGEYVCRWSEFVFYPGAVEALKRLSARFARIFVVTNQRAVAKGLMSEGELQDMHRRMTEEIERNQGRIDRIYFCTAMDDQDPCRKPNPGMALQAKKEFPQIDFAKSIMAGNTLSDMEFGRNAGMFTAFLKTTYPELPLPNPSVDLWFDDLLNFAKAC